MTLFLGVSVGPLGGGLETLTRLGVGRAVALAPLALLALGVGDHLRVEDPGHATVSHRAPAHLVGAMLLALAAGSFGIGGTHPRGMVRHDGHAGPRRGRGRDRVLHHVQHRRRGRHGAAGDPGAHRRSRPGHRGLVECRPASLRQGRCGGGPRRGSRRAHRHLGRGARRTDASASRSGPAWTRRRADDRDAPASQSSRAATAGRRRSLPRPVHHDRDPSAVACPRSRRGRDGATGDHTRRATTSPSRPARRCVADEYSHTSRHACAGRDADPAAQPAAWLPAAVAQRV